MSGSERVCAPRWRSWARCGPRWRPRWRPRAQRRTRLPPRWGAEAYPAIGCIAYPLGFPYGLPYTCSLRIAHLVHAGGALRGTRAHGPQRDPFTPSLPASLAASRVLCLQRCPFLGQPRATICSSHVAWGAPAPAKTPPQHTARALLITWPSSAGAQVCWLTSKAGDDNVAVQGRRGPQPPGCRRARGPWQPRRAGRGASAGPRGSRRSARGAAQPMLSQAPGPRARNVEVAAAGVPPRQSLARPACDAASMQANMRRLPSPGSPRQIPPAQAK